MGISQRFWHVARDVTRLHVRSQEVAIRNAMVASTALTQRRRELDDVEEFLVLHQRQWDVRRDVSLSERSVRARQTG